MNIAVNRRSLLTNAAVAAAVPEYVAAEPSGLAALIERHGALHEALSAACKHHGDLIERYGDELAPVRVQIGWLVAGSDEDGNPRREPIWAYDEEDIERHRRRHVGAGPALYFSQQEKDKINAWYDAQVAALRTLAATCAAKEDVLGITAAE